MASPSSPSAALGLIGLGLLGSALAERLLAGGFRVVGHDLEPDRGDNFARHGGDVAADAAEVFRRADRVLLSLPSHREVYAVLHPHASALRPGAILIDTTTGDPTAAEKIARELAARGIAYLDATVSGSSTHLRAGTAVLMIGGDAAAFAGCHDIFSCLSPSVHHTGGPGTGAKMKLATNAVLGLNRAALAEGLALARALGLDPTQTFAILRAGPAYSRIMDTKGPKMLAGDFTPEARLSQHLKDVRLLLEHGHAAGLPMTLSEAHRRVLEAAEAAGLGALDNSAIIRVLGSPAP